MMRFTQAARSVLLMGTIVASGVAATTLVAHGGPDDSAVLAKASGTEPFWHVNVTRQGIEYSALGADPIKFPYSAPVKAQSRPLSAARIYRLKNKSTYGLLIMNKTSTGFCNDGMSDNKYPFTSTVILQGKVYVGCASSFEDPMVPGENR
ncbi:hypothetical protein IQ266_14035 [filamentous cyanobacterium LEGE 11480]|uniref:Uncharacterized protein n=1 Tax=Romeriopsis navalis LEGE 11480 TaxID=2777977 RepID=A0A928VQ39_9CYAN|nr:hypothetical protein [Romeriopsis navalis]MBE9030851.1 hypothetical protein [Romeriopsis navalis LEGE 11480]